MNWYKSAKTRRGKFHYEFDGLELMNIHGLEFVEDIFFEGTAEIEFLIERDPGDRIDPPSVNVDLKATILSLKCYDAEENEYPVTEKMVKEVEEELESRDHLREEALDHEFD